MCELDRNHERVPRNRMMMRFDERKFDKRGAGKFLRDIEYVYAR